MIILGLAIAVGAAIGGVCRHVTLLIVQRLVTSPGVPLAIINGFGSAALGWLVATYERGVVDHIWFTALAVGWCGGFTTFSSAVTEVATTWRDGRPALAIAVAAIPLLIATCCFFATYALGLRQWS